jgi:hypothetical protein
MRMVTVTTGRQPNARARTTPPGTGELHRALEETRDRAELQRFCSAHVCTPAEVSSDGTRLDILRVFDLMRGRGYEISQPVRAPHQPKKGFTAWLARVRLPEGPSCDMGFYTTNTP